MHSPLNRTAIRALALGFIAVASMSCGRNTPPATSASPIAATPPPVGAGKLAPGQPLTVAQQHWVDSTLASLTLRQRIAQMVSIWVMGDFANERDPGYAQLV